MSEYLKQREKFRRDLNNILLSANDRDVRYLAFYLSEMIIPTSDLEYDFDISFMRLFVKHYHTRLSAYLNIEPEMFSYATFTSHLYLELGPVNKGDIFLPALRYITKVIRTIDTKP